MTLQSISYLGNLFYTYLGLYMYMLPLNIFLFEYIVFVSTIYIWICILIYLFKKNKFVSNVCVINMDIEKKTDEEMAERFGMSKRYMFFIFVDDILPWNVDILTIYSPSCLNPVFVREYWIRSYIFHNTFYILYYILCTKF